MYSFSTDKDFYIQSVGIVPGSDDQFKVHRMVKDPSTNEVDSDGVPIPPEIQTTTFRHSIDISSFNFSGNRIGAHRFTSDGQIVFDDEKMQKIEAKEEEARLKAEKEKEERAKIPSNKELAMSVADLEDCVLDMSILLYS